MLSHRGIIASSILRPVVEVLVGPGDRVMKGQVLIKLYDLEPQAKVRATGEGTEKHRGEGHSTAGGTSTTPSVRVSTGAMPENVYNDVRATALSNEAQVPAAEAELALAESELKLYTVIGFDRRRDRLAGRQPRHGDVAGLAGLGRDR